MKKGIALVLAAMLTLFACGAWAEEEHTDEEVQALVAEELALSREVAFYPAAFEGDFEQFYVAFHKLARAQYEAVSPRTEPGIDASYYEDVICLLYTSPSPRDA